MNEKPGGSHSDRSSARDGNDISAGTAARSLRLGKKRDYLIYSDVDAIRPGPLSLSSSSPVINGFPNFSPLR